VPTRNSAKSSKPKAVKPPEKKKPAATKKAAAPKAKKAAAPAAKKPAARAKKLPEMKVVSKRPAKKVAAGSAPRPPATEVIGELPLMRDFFVDPRKPALQTAYGDDRLLCFRREPLAVVVSWDLASGTWGDGEGVWLELIDGRGQLVARSMVSSAQGLATFESLPHGRAITAQLIQRGRVMTRGKPFMLGGAEEDGPRQQMTVEWNEKLPAPGETEFEEYEGPSGTMVRRRRRIGSSRLSTSTSSRV
jgi:hypothetical protein